MRRAEKSRTAASAWSPDHLPSRSRWAAATSWATSTGSRCRAASTTAATATEAASDSLVVGLRFRGDLCGVELVHFVYQIVRHQLGRRHLVLDHVPLEEEVDVRVEVLDGAFAPLLHAACLELPVLGAGEERLHVVAQRLLLALAARLRLRIDLVEDLHRGLGIRDREHRSHRVTPAEGDRLRAVLLQRLLEREEAVRREARKRPGVEEPHRHAGAVDERVLRVVHRQRLHLSRTEERRRLGGFSDDDDARVLVRIETVHGEDAARDVHAAGGHRGDPDLLPFEILDGVDRALFAHRDPVDVPLIGRVEDLRLHTLRPGGGERLDRRQRVRQVAGGDELHAVGRSGNGNELHGHSFASVETLLHRDGEGSGRGGDGARAEPHLDVLRPSGEREEGDGDGDRFHRVSPFTFTEDDASFCEGSQKRTRLRTSTTTAFSPRPRAARMKSTANSPATSMLKLRLWMSMPSPASEPTNSATMAPTSAKTIATSSPAMRKGSAEGSRSIQKICICVAPSERIRSTRSSSAERSPTMVFTRSGKKAISAALTTFEPRPRPNHTIMSGASATFGIDWNMTMYG